MTFFRRTSLLAAAIAVASAVCGPVIAGDWSIKTNLSETLSINDNNGLVEDPEGFLFGANSKLTLDILRQSRIDEFLLSGSLGYQTYFGDAADIPSDRLLPSLRTSYLRRGKTTDVSFGASYLLEPATNTSGLEIADESQKGDRETFNVNGSVVHRINARNDVTLAARALKVDFIHAADFDSPFVSLGSTLTWQRRETKRVDLTLSSSVDWYDYDLNNRERFYYVLRGGPQVRLSERLTLHGNVGATLTDTSRDPDPPGPRLSKTAVGALADAGFNYLLKTGALTGAVSYGLTPDENGKFQNSLNFSAAVSHTINDLTSVHLGGQYVLADSAIDGSLANATLSISPSLSYTLARDWQMTASYQFVWQDDEHGDAYQNAVYLTLSRNYVLMP